MQNGIQHCMTQSSLRDSHTQQTFLIFSHNPFYQMFQHITIITMIAIFHHYILSQNI